MTTKDNHQLHPERHFRARFNLWLKRRSGVRSSFPAIVLAASALLCGSIVTAQAGAVPDIHSDPADWPETEVGVPVTDQLTIEKCGGCHTPDAKGNLSRISWIRATPEGWSQAIKRMVKLNGLYITPQEARSVVKYLGTWHGLSPEEAKPVMYIAERRVLDETNIPNDTVRSACTTCHAFGQPMSSRRSRREWGLLQNMHKALYAQAAVWLNRPAADQPEDAKPPKLPLTQGQVALEYLSKEADLNTKSWSEWRPRLGSPKLAGKWIVSATLRGRGKYVGEMTISPSGEDFSTAINLLSLDTGATTSLSGKGLIYAGYSWRGTTNGSSSAVSPSDISGEMRETMWFSPDQQSAEGRWYWGEYHEFGLDVKLMRASAAPVLVTVSPAAIQMGSKGQEITLYGAAFSNDLKASDLDMGPGVVVRSVQVMSPSQVVAKVDVSSDAVLGLHDVALAGMVLPKALPVYASMDFLKVTPETSLTHLGGIKYGKGYEQFEATAWSAGADGKPNTMDDFPIMPVDVDWSMEEFITVTYDDDVKYVGALDASGLFTPNVEGPNPDRKFSRNNYGEVWVVATSKDRKDKMGKPLSAKAYLVTTVPAYKRWDQPEVSQ